MGNFCLYTNNIVDTKKKKQEKLSAVCQLLQDDPSFDFYDDDQRPNNQQNRC